MGIQGLLPLLERATKPVNVLDLSGSVCVIDGNGWLHRASYGCAQDLYKGLQTDLYVNYFLKRCQHLVSVGIKPIVVFDGQRLPAKEVTHRQRQATKRNVRNKIELLLAEGQDSKANELMKQCIEITPQMTRKLINALREKQVDIIVAPFEADPQIAYLVNNGFADFVITEDSDLLVFNCRLCLFKLDAKGNGQLMDMSLLKECLGDGFDVNKLRHMSIMSGCDYLANLPGIGLQRAKKFFKLTTNSDLKTVLFKIPNYLKMTKKVKVSQQYVNDFIRADNTFRYQLVFCPKLRQLVPLTPYENNITANELSYAGIHFNEDLGNDFAFQYAIGNVDTKTLDIIDSYNFEPNEDSIWSKDWLNYKSKQPSLNESHHISHQSTVIPQTTVQSNNLSPNSFKRQKIDENTFVSCRQLVDEYSVEIFSKESSEEFQSKYFKREKKQNMFTSIANKRMRLTTDEDNCYNNVSQHSLNSSGNTTIDTLDDTLTMSDTERSEISETSDEDIGIFDDCFTNTKSIVSQSANKTFSSFLYQ
ncbi:exonuclease 1-like [Oppia nitens]|uniref:exonuclease 1-like n=1 Tax=Oppia nitens TaxID=1686743 RepID=UPI0023D9961E|nr:exonuclease 1-like [Oppia nitens]